MLSSFTGCGGGYGKNTATPEQINTILSIIDNHYPDSVDFHFGSTDWRTAVLQGNLNIGSRPDEIIDFMYNSTLLHYAAGEGAGVWTDEGKKMATQLTKALLDAGANPNIQQRNGETPLHSVAEENYPVIARLLLDAGANPDIKERDEGYTPLHTASGEGNWEIVEILIEAGADENIRNHNGRTPSENVAHYNALYERWRQEEKNETSDTSDTTPTYAPSAATGASVSGSSTGSSIDPFEACEKHSEYRRSEGFKLGQCFSNYPFSCKAVIDRHAQIGMDVWTTLSPPTFTEDCPCGREHGDYRFAKHQENACFARFNTEPPNTEPTGGQR